MPLSYSQNYVLIFQETGDPWHINNSIQKVEFPVASIVLLYLFFPSLRLDRDVKFELLKWSAVTCVRTESSKRPKITTKKKQTRGHCSFNMPFIDQWQTLTLLQSRHKNPSIPALTQRNHGKDNPIQSNVPKSAILLNTINMSQSYSPGLLKTMLQLNDGNCYCTFA